MYLLEKVSGVALDGAFLSCNGCLSLTSAVTVNSNSAKYSCNIFCLEEPGNILEKLGMYVLCLGSFHLAYILYKAFSKKNMNQTPLPPTLVVILLLCEKELEEL